MRRKKYIHRGQRPSKRQLATHKRLKATHEENYQEYQDQHSIFTPMKEENNNDEEFSTRKV